MLMTETELRRTIRGAILLAEEEKKIVADLDATTNQVAADGEDALDDMIDELMGMATEMKEDPEEFAKSVQETYMVRGNKQPINEGLGFLAVGTAAALPVILDGVSKLVELLEPLFDKMFKVFGKERKEGGMTDPEWWHKKSHALHDLYIGGIKKAISLLCFLTQKKISEEKKKSLANGIWIAIVAFLMYKSGVGLVKALGSHTYGLAGAEGILTGIKGQEIGAYVKGLLVTAGIIASA